MEYLKDYQDSYDAVKQSDFILPGEVEKAMNFKYSQEALDHFLYTLPGKEEVRWYKENDFICIPGPPEIFSMDKIVSMEPELFLFEEDQIKIICDMYHFGLATSWIFIKKKDLINQIASCHVKHYEVNCRMWPKNVKYSCPSPAALAWTMLIYKKTRNINLFNGFKIMTSPRIPFYNGYCTRIVFTWNDGVVEIKQTKRPDTLVDVTCIIDSVPLIALEEDDDLPF